MENGGGNATYCMDMNQVLCEMFLNANFTNMMTDKL